MGAFAVLCALCVSAVMFLTNPGWEEAPGLEGEEQEDDDGEEHQDHRQTDETIPDHQGIAGLAAAAHTLQLFAGHTVVGVDA